MNGEFERLIKTIFESPARAAALSNQSWTPPLDVWETEGELVYAFDLPGIPEEKIAVDLEDSTLTVSGSRERSEIEDGRHEKRKQRDPGSQNRAGLRDATRDECDARPSNSEADPRHDSSQQRNRGYEPQHSVIPVVLEPRPAADGNMLHEGTRRPERIRSRDDPVTVQ